MRFLSNGGRSDRGTRGMFPSRNLKCVMKLNWFNAFVETTQYYKFYPDHSEYVHSQNRNARGYIIRFEISH